jgi:hypothetical protein
LVFRPSEIAASVALVAFGERNSSVVERATANCKYINKVFISSMLLPIKSFVPPLNGIL